MDNDNQNIGATEPKQTNFQIQRVYTKNISFEAPGAPAIFKAEWRPEIKLDLDSKAQDLGSQNYEVVLSVTVTAQVGEQVGFLCEVEQAGIFTFSDLPEPQKRQMLGAFIPNILFPYARETIASMVNKGTFPPLNLAPVNFDAIFAAYTQQQAEQSGTTNGANGESAPLQ